MNETLYIVGNGFDCHHGIKSRYLDFKEWLNINNYPLFEKVDLSFRDNVEFWSDMETQLGHLNTAQFHEDNFKEICLSANKDFYIHEFQNHSSENALRIMVDELIRNLKTWCLSFDYSHVKADVPLNKDAYFITFNYTDTLERCYGVPNKQIFYIHGRANSDDDLILGSGISSGEIIENKFNGEYTGDEDHDNLISEVGRLKKPVYKIIHRNPQVFKKHEKLKAITIMGFSFSEIDIPYLQHLNTLNPQVVKWNLCFHSLEDLRRIVKFVEASGISCDRLQLSFF